jgi:glycosyltransferase involved in cell wall biosynthesis
MCLAIGQTEFKMTMNPTDTASVHLSIVIPTMDRRTLFAETLSTITPQLCPGVELVVLDGSKDPQPVKEMVEKAGGRYTWQKPRGFDQAYLDAVELARGEYIWLFGDDDLMKPHAIETALATLKKSGSLPGAAAGSVPLDLLIVNADVVGSESSRILKEEVVTMPETEYGLAERSEVVAKLGGLMSFMGSIIVLKSFWARGVAPASEHLGKRLITMIVPLFVPARRVLFIPSVLVSARYGHQSWMDTASTLIGKTMTDVIWSLPDVADYAKQTCTPRPPAWQTLLLWRALGQPIGTLPYLNAKLIGMFPAGFIRWLCRMWLRLVGKTNSMTGYALGF